MPLSFSLLRDLSIFLTHMHICTTGFCVWLRMGLWGWRHAAVSLIILYKGNAFVTLFDKNDVFFWSFWWFDELKYVLWNVIKHTIYQNNLGEVHMLLPNWNSCYLDKRTMMVQSHKNLKKIMFGDFFKYYFFYCLERNRHTYNISLSYTLHYFLLTALSSFCELIFGPHNQGLEHSDTFD